METRKEPTIKTRVTNLIETLPPDIKESVALEIKEAESKEQKLLEVKHKVRALKREQGELAKKLDDANKTAQQGIDQKTQALNAVQAESNEMSTSITSLNKQLDALHQDNTSQKKKLDQISNEIAQIRSLLEETPHDLNHLKLTHLDDETCTQITEALSEKQKVLKDELAYFETLLLKAEMATRKSADQYNKAEETKEVKETKKQPEVTKNKLSGLKHSFRHAPQDTPNVTSQAIEVDANAELQADQSIIEHEKTLMASKKEVYLQDIEKMQTLMNSVELRKSKIAHIENSVAKLKDNKDRLLEINSSIEENDAQLNIIGIDLEHTVQAFSNKEEDLKKLVSEIAKDSTKHAKRSDKLKQAKQENTKKRLTAETEDLPLAQQESATARKKLQEAITAAESLVLLNTMGACLLDADRLVRLTVPSPLQKIFKRVQKFILKDQEYAQYTSARTFYDREIYVLACDAQKTLKHPIGKHGSAFFGDAIPAEIKEKRLRRADMLYTAIISTTSVKDLKLALIKIEEELAKKAEARAQNQGQQHDATGNNDAAFATEASPVAPAMGLNP